MFKSILLVGIVFISSFFQCQNGKPVKLNVGQTEIINPEGKTIQERFAPPKDYTRLNVEKGSFAAYLRQFPLLNDGTPVLLYNGNKKSNQNIHAAVLNIDIGSKDLQQCADACMRLWAEYLFQKQDFESIHFNFTNGFYFDYPNWRKGNRISVNGNKVNWYNAGQADTSYRSFRKYMNLVFSYAGTWSLSQELKGVKPENIEIGHLFLQGGHPGHSVIVMDMVVNEQGEKLMLLAQSYMPAQSIHVLKNLQEQKISPWYHIPQEGVLRTPEWTFTSNDIRKFN